MVLINMVNWAEIDTVLLDMDGTLLDLHFDNYFWLQHLPEKYALKNRISFEQALARVKALSESLYGSLQWYCLDYWSDELGMDVEKLKRDIGHMIKQRPYCQEFLTYLNRMEKHILLVTNAHPKALELKVASSGLADFIEKFISSHEFELAKENEGFWAKLESREALDLSRCLFIDDSLNVLQCARREGVGYTLQVLQPDSSQPEREVSEFQGIRHFSELMT